MYGRGQTPEMDSQNKAHTSAALFSFLWRFSDAEWPWGKNGAPVWLVGFIGTPFPQKKLGKCEKEATHWATGGFLFTTTQTIEPPDTEKNPLGPGARRTPGQKMAIKIQSPDCPSEHPIQSTKVGSLKWVVNSPTNMGSQNGLDNHTLAGVQRIGARFRILENQTSPE